MKPGTFLVITTEGVEHLNLDKPTIGKCLHAMGYPNGCIDTVNLRDGRVMMVEDNSAVDNLPINEKATKLYWSVCKPGTTWPIRGNVVIAWDSDFA